MKQPFDPDLSNRPTRIIPVDRVVDLLGVPHAHDRIRMYRKAMASGDRFPPISVFRLGNIYVITDGHKRFMAVSELGLNQIVVELWGIGALSSDLLAQMWGQICKGAIVIARVHHGPKARRRACWYFLSFFYHWKRILLSFRQSTHSDRENPKEHHRNHSNDPPPPTRPSCDRNQGSPGTESGAR